MRQDDANPAASTPEAQRLLLESRLRYHHRCLQEDATDPDLTALERRTLVRGRAARMWETRREIGDHPTGRTTRRRLPQ